MAEIWDIYDNKGNKTGKTIERGQPLADDEFHLVVHIWIKFNDKYLIQKRPDHAELKPGWWATTCGSAVSGETDIQAAVRETKEGLGIEVKEKDLELYFANAANNDFTKVFVATLDESALGSIKPSPKEVEDVKFADNEDIAKMVQDGDFIDYGEDYFFWLLGEELAD